MNKNWYIFIFIWILILSIGPITLLSDFPISFAFKNTFTTINFFQRLVGLTLFALIFTQVVLGSMMNKWTELLTGKIFRFHVIEGITAYTLMFVHPTLGALNGVSLLPIFTRAEFFYDLGRLSFVLFTLSVFAGLLRNQPFLIQHWRKLHILNYVAFYLIAIHSYFGGSDVRSFPFIILWWIAVLVVTSIVIYKFGKASTRT